MHSSRSVVSELSPVKVKLDVQIPWDHIQEHLNETLGRLQKGAHVKGFRPGKAPRNVIEQVYGKRVRADVVATVVEESLMSAFHEHSLSPVTQPELDLPEFKNGEELSFTATVEVRPKIADVVIEPLPLVRQVESVDDKVVDAELTRIRESHAELKAPEPARASKKTDVLIVDYAVVMDGEEKPEMAAKERSIALESGQLLPELEAGLTGKNVGERFPVTVSFPEDYWQETLRAKTAVFDIEIKKHLERVLPAIDDDFAKHLGKFENVAALRADVRSKLEDAARDRAESKLKESLIDKLIELNPVPLPPTLVEYERQAMLEEVANLLRMTRYPMNEADASDIEKNMGSRAERKVRASLLFSEIAKKQSFNVKPEEVDAELGTIAARTGKPLAKLRVEYQGDRAQALASSILEHKIVSYLLSKATIEERKVDHEQP